jgi:hypothetical protein
MLERMLKFELKADFDWANKELSIIFIEFFTFEELFVQPSDLKIWAKHIKFEVSNQ